jgi:hypothetical protein
MLLLHIPLCNGTIALGGTLAYMLSCAPLTLLPLCAAAAAAAAAAYVPLCSGTIALGGTLAYILSFAIGAGPVSGLIVPEINKEAVRGEQRIFVF